MLIGGRTLNRRFNAEVKIFLFLFVATTRLTLSSSHPLISWEMYSWKNNVEEDLFLESWRNK